MHIDGKLHDTEREVPYEFSVPGSLAVGTHTVEFKAYDKLGNRREASYQITVKAPTEPPPPPPTGEGKLVWSQAKRTVTCPSGGHTCTNAFIELSSQGSKHFEYRFTAEFPSSWRWGSGDGFKMPGPGGEALNGKVPNGCDHFDEGWSARQQWTVEGSESQVCAYLYLDNTKPPAINNLSINDTGCGTIVKNKDRSKGRVRAGDKVFTRQVIKLNTAGQSNGSCRIYVSVNDGPEVLVIDHNQLRFYSSTTKGLTHAIPVVYFGGRNTSPQTQPMTLGPQELYRFD
jgi:hypothetical protein